MFDVLCSEPCVWGVCDVLDSSIHCWRFGGCSWGRRRVKEEGVGLPEAKAGSGWPGSAGHSVDLRVGRVG